MTRFPGCKLSLLWNFNFKLHMNVDGGHRQKSIGFQPGHIQNGRLVAILDFLVSRLWTLVSLWISTPNLSGTILMYMCRSPLIFSNVNFKMAARQPYCNYWFPDSNFSLALNINCKLKWHNTYIDIWVGAYWFSATSLSKWPPGGHIGFFGFRTDFTLALNINSKLQWQSICVYG